MRLTYGENTGPVIQAGDQVIIASDVISLDGGIILDDLVSAQGEVITPGNTVVYDTSVSGPGQVGTLPGATLPMPVTIFNNGPEADVYDLTWSDAAGWHLTGLPNTISVDALAIQDLTLNVELPADVPLQSVNIVTLTVASRGDPSQTSTANVEVEALTLGWGHNISALAYEEII